MNEMNNDTVQHHFHLFEMYGFLSLTLRNISLVSTWLKSPATPADMNPRITKNIIS